MLRVGLLLTICVEFFSPAVGMAAEVDPTWKFRQALESELPFLEGSDWNTRPSNWNSDSPPASVLGFVNPVGPALQFYRNKLREVSPWNTIAVWHQAGFLQFSGAEGSYRLGVNVFFPKGRLRGTLLFVHGYLAHAGVFSYTLDQFSQKGWAIVTLDLPGHGFSGGDPAAERSDILDFEDYGRAVGTFFRWAQSQRDLLPRPWVEAAHSLGAASTLQYLASSPAVVADRTIFVAPLVHTYWYEASLVGYALSGWAIRSLDPVFPWDGYLGGYRFPTHWFKAVADWASRFETRKPFPFSGLVIQGDKDTVVDANWDIPFLKKLLVGAEFQMVPGANHTLMTDRNEREDTQARLEAYLIKEGFQ